MGQGSRGGNGGLSSSGSRQRDDKELGKAKKDARTVGKSADSAGKRSGEGGGGGRGIPNGRVPRARGLRGLSRLARDLGKLAPKTSSGSSGSKASAKTVRPQAIKPQNKIPTIVRTNAPKTKLTKQRTNKTPN